MAKKRVKLAKARPPYRATPGDPGDCLLAELCSYWRQAHQYYPNSRVLQCPDQLENESSIHCYREATILHHCYRPLLRPIVQSYREESEDAVETLFQEISHTLSPSEE